MTQMIVRTLTQLAVVVNLQGNSCEAARIYDEIETATKTCEPKRRKLFRVNGARVSTLYRTHHIEAGIPTAQALVARNTARFGAANTAYARWHPSNWALTCRPRPRGN
jgi:hypothetical protein